jgi:hypothetical protein
VRKSPTIESDSMGGQEDSRERKSTVEEVEDSRGVQYKRAVEEYSGEGQCRSGGVQQRFILEKWWNLVTAHPELAQSSSKTKSYDRE